MRLSLRQKTWLCMMSILLAAVLASALILLWAVHTEKTREHRLGIILDEAAAIGALSTHLLADEGLVALCVANGSPAHLAEREQREALFDRAMGRLNTLLSEQDEKALIGPIGEAFSAYKDKAGQAIAMAGRGKDKEATRILHDEAMPYFNRASELCEALQKANRRDVELAVQQQEVQMTRLAGWVTITLILAACLAGGMLRLSFNRLFQPLAQIADEAHLYSAADAQAARDEVRTLGRYVENLKSDVVEARSNLAQSHTRLLDAEKLATVGKLAAGVAHEIRSPLTSLKLRLFSMRKNLGAYSGYEADLQVMSEEINRLDNIIRNFLEFSRAPEIKVGPCDVSLLLDKTVEVLRYKLDAAAVRVDRDEPLELPPVLADAQQLKQVFINLLNNAVEAMPKGGHIHLTLRPGTRADGRRMIVVRVRDEGPGIPDAVLNRVFVPFFTTKHQGAGLGLWISQRIMTEHGGSLEIEESTKRGTAFAAWIPVDQESLHEQNTGG